MVGLGALLVRKVFVIFGAIGSCFYLGHLASNVFKDSWFFPVALMAIGLGVVYVGIWWQKNEANITHKARNVLPKPLIPINQKTMLEEIFERFNAYGSSNFFISLNYKSDLINVIIKFMDSSKKLTGPVNIGNPIEMTIKELENVCYETIEKNEPFFNETDEHRLMINVSRGPLGIYGQIFDNKKPLIEWLVTCNCFTVL